MRNAGKFLYDELTDMLIYANKEMQTYFLPLILVAEISISPNITTSP